MNIKFQTLRHGLCAGVLAAAISFAAAAPAVADGGFDRDLFKQWVTARAGGGTGAVYWYSEGDVTEYPSGKVLVRMEGFDVSHLVWPDPKVDTAYQLSRKIYLFRDLKTNEVIREFNGKPVAVVKFPYQYITYSRDGDKLNTWVEQGSGPSYLKLGPESDIQVRRLGRTSVFSAPLYLDVKGPAGVQRTLFENYDFFIQPAAKDPREQFQLSWLRYGSRGGFSDQPTITHMVSWRVDRFADLPLAMRTFIETEARLWLEPPKDLAEIQRLQKE